MAEAFVQVILDNLSSLIAERIGLIMGVDEEMKKLSSTLTTIQAVLEDAEDKQSQSKPIQDWLRKLNVLAYEIDDILDDCNTHFSKLGSKLSLYSRLKKNMHRHKIASRVKRATERLDSVAAERAKFHLREFPVDRPREIAAPRETGSLLSEPEKVYGRGEDREKIVKMLVEDAGAKQEISVLPILGVGGLGKTTLAKLVFNDPKVVDHFERRLWVCVSDDFDIKTMLKSMIEYGTGKAADVQGLAALERHLWELLRQKRYLIVLDDVWNDQQHKWLELRTILSCGSTGSSIIVTTRQRKIADIMGTLLPHCPEGLSDEHCWTLLKQCAFGREEEKEHPELVMIGKQIVRKCVGVPLAAMALGGILRFKRREEEWIAVRESEMWKIKEHDSLILPVLRLSYHHLPLELRQCFAYFAAFPKSYQVRREELIRLWIAHGFISSKGSLQIEDVGNEICDELLLRSLLQLTVHNRMRMHDLVHDLAQSVMENKVPGILSERITANASTIRQVNLEERNVMFPKTFVQDMDITNISELTSLRVLDASHTRIIYLPHSIANLRHLRYLDLSYSGIQTLPDSLCTLWNLQTILLVFCLSLVALPKNMRYLRNLQHLRLEYCDTLSDMPPKMGELTRLKTLSMFVVGLNRGNRLEELQFLNLRGRLEIKHLERVKDHMDAKKPNLAHKKDLKELSFSWERDNSSELDQENDEKVLEALEPHPNLEFLCIKGFMGRCFPAWMTDSTLPKIVEIEIEDCRNCRRIPKLGMLPRLKILLLRNVEVEYIVEEEEVGDASTARIQFPALEKLDLHNLPSLKGLSKEKESKEAFPNLKRLIIESCSSLVLPPVSSLKKLEDLQCRA